MAVVAGENEYGNVASQIGGKYVSVYSVDSNPNTDPHTYEATPSVGQKIAKANLLIENGVGYDTFMDTLASASPNSARKVINVQHLLGLPDSTPNPHLWYDPKTMPAVAQALASDLSALDPAHAVDLPGERDQVRGFAAAVVQRHRRVQGQIRGDDRGDDRAGRRLPADGHGDQQPDAVPVPGRHHERHRPHAPRTCRWRRGSSPSIR